MVSSSFFWWKSWLHFWELDSPFRALHFIPRWFSRKLLDLLYILGAQHPYVISCCLNNSSSVATLVSQTIVLALSMMRYRFLYRQGYWEGTRIIRLMSRDGTMAFAMFFGLYGCSFFLYDPQNAPVLSLLMLVYHELHEPFAPDEYTYVFSVYISQTCMIAQCTDIAIISGGR